MMIDKIDNILEEEVGNSGLTDEEIRLNYLPIDVLERPSLSVAYIIAKGY